MTDFPGPFAPLDQRLNALADLLRRIPGTLEFEGVSLKGSILRDLEDAALVIRAHHDECPEPQRTTYRETTHGKSYLRRAYG